MEEKYDQLWADCKPELDKFNYITLVRTDKADLRMYHSGSIYYFLCINKLHNKFVKSKHYTRETAWHAYETGRIGWIAQGETTTP